MIPALDLLSQTVEPEVRNWGKTKKVKILDPDDNIVDRMVECVTSGEFEVFNRPTAAEIEEVVEFLRPKPEPATRQVVIQHVDTVNVFISGDASAVSRLELPDGG